MVGIFKKLFKKEKITKKYKNGDTYVGEVKNDKPHGHGTYTWADGRKYVGEWKDDSMCGQGTITVKESKFVGKFKDGERIQGTHTWISGESAGNKYVGDFEGDEQHGQGTFTWADGDKYVGEYKDGKKYGQGTYTSNEIKFVGKFKDDEMIQGTHAWISGEFAGNKYVGEYKDGEFHGQGTHTWADGSKYVGEWEGGEQCGGTFTSADGKVEKITKTIKRNELAIFEELRLKIPTSLSNEVPEKSELKKINNIFYYYNEKFKKNTYWQKNPTGRIVQVNQYGELIFSSNDEHQRNIPKKFLLKKYKTDVRFHRDEHIKDCVTWWAEDKNGELVQVNVKKEDVGIEFKIRSWLRNEAIDHVGLEIRSLKNKAYNYSKEELLEMIKEEEGKIIRKQGWKALRIAALSSLGLSWLPFV
jgi:hypothetical protein